MGPATDATVEREGGQAGGDVAVRRRASELKEAGNKAYTRKELARAVELYTQALALEPQSHVLYANRSAAHLDAGALADALADARRAVELSPPSYAVKARVRAARALTALGRHREAAAALAVARQSEPASDYLWKLERDAVVAADKHDAKGPIRDADHWLDVFAHVRAPRLRLATLAVFWNESTQAERFAVFNAFLGEVAGAGSVAPPAAAAKPGPAGGDTPMHAGSSADGSSGSPATAAAAASHAPPELPALHISHFSQDQFGPLPMHNYADLDIPLPWQTFYKSRLRDSDAKVALFRRCWHACTSDEQRLIMHDFVTFFPPQSGGQAPPPSESTDSGSEAARASEPAAPAAPAGAQRP